MSDEDEIRERVMAYLGDRRAFELYASSLVSTDPSGRSRPPENGALRELLDRLDAYQRRHRTTASMKRGSPLTFGTPPSVDPARTSITSVKITGRKATASTVETELPTPYEYLLEREAEQWLLVDRRTPGDPIMGPKWIKGLR